jgi:hypothetical protein
MHRNPPDKLTILQHNVRGWKTNKAALTNIYNNINPDIILINEHGITTDERLKIFNYNVHTNNKTNRRSHGTAIAIRQDIEYRLIDDFTTDLLAVTIQTRQGEVTIATAYSPPNSPYLNLIDYMTLFRRPEPLYFLGDLNARHRIFRHNDNNAVGRNVNTLLMTDKCRHVGPHFPTLIRHNSTTSPDIVLTNDKTFHNLHLKPGPLTPSDHIPLIAVITVQPILIPIKPRKSFHKADWDNYKRQLADVITPNDPHPTLEDIDTYLDDWTDKIKQATEDNIPTITHRTLPGIKPDQDMRTLEIRYNAIRDELYDNGPSIELNRLMNDIKQDLRTGYKRLQNQIWNDLVDGLDLEDDSTKFWKTIRRLQGNDKQKIPYLRDHDNNKVYDEKDKEELFRRRWTKIFSADDDPDNDFNYDHIEYVEDELSLRLERITTYNYGDLNRLDVDCPRITLGELDQTLNKFKQKAPGPTGITAIQLKQLPLNMKQHLLYIFNHSLSLGYFPDKLKHATMIFIPKGNTSQYNIINYRPISLLDIQGKLFDKILNTRLTHFLEQHNYTNSRQHGFRKIRGTHTALAIFYETLSIKQTQKHATDVVLRDVSKAFDKVWHTGLKYKLTQLPLHPCYTKIISDYITDRTASIQIGNYTGPSFPLNSGVPQGACLSPTLYNFYTHDLPQPLPNTDYISFADDITQITSGRYKSHDAARNTEHAIQQINTFEQKWKIQTNKNKFKIIPISRHITHDINIGNDHYTYTNKGKILGLNFTTNGITPQPHIRRAIALDNLNKLQRFRNLTQNNKIKLYKSLILPTLIYPTVPMHTIAKYTTLSLQRVQNRALRSFITNTHWSQFRTSQSLHEQCNIPPINTLMHKHARKTWETIEDHLPETYNYLKHTLPVDFRRHGRFPSSLLLAESPPPEPMYV